MSLKNELEAVDKENLAFRRAISMIISMAKRTLKTATFTGNEGLKKFASEIITYAERELEQ